MSGKETRTWLIVITSILGLGIVGISLVVSGLVGPAW